MDAREGQSETSPPAPQYTLPPSRYASEDIMFCIDIDSECLKEMKVSSGQVFTRLDTLKQSILLFMHAKLSINSDHRFAFCALGKSTYWLQKEFSSTLDSALAAFRGITEHYSSDQADLTQLFRAAAHEAKKSRAQNRILRLVLLYCRSSVAPHHQWPVTQKLFTLDVMYLHDKPGPENCPQKVYDALVDALEQVSEYEGYIFESGQGLPRILFRHMCVLLSHPQQRCVQDDIDIPKSLTKKPASAESTTGGEIVPVSN
ncbi:uncharacterized protein LOC141675120 [Apium graveolens]|uniref:uncharacterized protein LOC141675120 n=1 Tax=Apium graveolens TaxID=4045 RepID=UPI003D7A6C3E